MSKKQEKKALQKNKIKSNHQTMMISIRLEVPLPLLRNIWNKVLCGKAKIFFNPYDNQRRYLDYRLPIHMPCTFYKMKTCPNCPMEKAIDLLNQ